MWLFKKSQSKVSSRRQIAIKEVQDGILTLPNNEYRLVLASSSVNFELKSEDEQDVLIDSFQNFLNALPCKLQILIRVRELDIDEYVGQILQATEKEKELVYKDQIQAYCDFIRNLVSGNKILSRHFYIVVPYTAEDKYPDRELVREQLHLTRDLVMKSLDKLGMKARQLDSLELLDLFYSFYNPSQIKTQALKGQTIERLLEHHYV